MSSSGQGNTSVPSLHLERQGSTASSASPPAHALMQFGVSAPVVPLDRQFSTPVIGGASLTSLDGRHPALIKPTTQTGTNISGSGADHATTALNSRPNLAIELPRTPGPVPPSASQSMNVSFSSPGPAVQIVSQNAATTSAPVPTLLPIHAIVGGGQGAGEPASPLTASMSSIPKIQSHPTSSRPSVGGRTPKVGCRFPQVEYEPSAGTAQPGYQTPSMLDILPVADVLELTSNPSIAGAGTRTDDEGNISDRVVRRSSGVSNVQAMESAPSRPTADGGEEAVPSNENRTESGEGDGSDGDNAGSASKSEQSATRKKSKSNFHYNHRFALLLGCILINEAAASTMLLPFVGLLVASFEGGDRNSAGYVSGFLIGVFQFAQVFCAPIWGRKSDVVGRRPVIVIGILAGCVAVICFGFCRNLWLALIFRFLHGALNANTAVAKTATLEATDGSSEAKGFAMISATWSIGSMIGPAVGGVMYDPCTGIFKGMNLSPDNILCKYPASLPCFLSAAYGIFAAFLAYFFLPETNPTATGFADLLPSCLRGKRHSEEGPQPDGVDVEMQDESPPTSKSPQSTPAGSNTTSPTDGTSKSATKDVKEKFTLADCWKNTLIRRLYSNYMAICAANIAFAECLPLWAIAAVARGGLGLQSTELGLFFTLNGAFGILVNFIFAPLTKMMSKLKLWRISVIGWAIAISSFPLVGFLRASSSDAQIVIALGVLTFFRSVCANNAFSLNMMFIGNSAPPAHKGSVMGYGQSVAAISRCVAPVLFAPLFAWSIAETRPYPLNHFFVFYVATCCFIWPFFSSYALTEKDVSRVEPLSAGARDEVKGMTSKGAEEDHDHDHDAAPASGKGSAA